MSSSLTTLRRQYFALLPPYLLTLPPSSVLSLPSSQRYLIDHLLSDPYLSAFQPEAGYRRTFWRRIIAVLEESGGDVEIEEKLYDAVSSLMVSSTPTGPPPKSFKTFIYGENELETESRITLVEEQIAVQNGTTGLRTCLHLAHHILQNPTLLPSSSVVELGAGTGFLSILLSQIGFEVVATDLGSEGEGEEQEEQEWRTPLQRLKGNIQLNQLDKPPRALALDWNDLEKDGENWHLLTGERTIVAADVVGRTPVHQAQR
ncbi:hypothetical protein P7C73_g1024, partial [Tremellales sp. Uapishka_1]